jgi:hypothetical protein
MERPKKESKLPKKLDQGFRLQYGEQMADINFESSTLCLIALIANQPNQINRF